jgi:hypothetical protein
MESTTASAIDVDSPGGGVWASLRAYASLFLVGVFSPLFVFPGLLFLPLGRGVTSVMNLFRGGQRFGQPNTLTAGLSGAFIVLPLQGLVAGIGGNWAFFCFSRGDFSSGGNVLAITLAVSGALIYLVARDLYRQRTPGLQNPFDPETEPESGRESIRRSLSCRMPILFPSREVVAVEWAALGSNASTDRLAQQPGIFRTCQLIRLQRTSGERAQVAIFVVLSALASVGLVAMLCALAPAGLVAIWPTRSQSWTWMILIVLFTGVSWLDLWIWRIGDTQDRARRRRELLVREGHLQNDLDAVKSAEERVAAERKTLDAMQERLDRIEGMQRDLAARRPPFDAVFALFRHG